MILGHIQWFGLLWHDVYSFVIVFFCFYIKVAHKWSSHLNLSDPSISSYAIHPVTPALYMSSFTTFINFFFGSFPSAQQH